MPRLDPKSGYEYQRKWRKANPEKVRGYWLKQRAKNPEGHKIKQRKAHIKYRYGISVEDYEIMVQAQNGNCGICLKKTKRLYVDHNHKTKKIRGLLCNTCNSAIGLLQDSPEILMNAAKYLEGNNGTAKT
jgi:hypothetical protein